MKEVRETDWREDLKHVEPAKDASAPRIESNSVHLIEIYCVLTCLPGDVKIKKNPHAEVMKEVRETDWREDLKHIEPVKDASAPMIPRT
jgi:hypothetical protein